MDRRRILVAGSLGAIAPLQAQASRSPVNLQMQALFNPTEGYGRIETIDGRLVYFHRNSLVEADFDDLGIGTEVRFVEEMGELGPQASTVHVIGKHHVVG